MNEFVSAIGNVGFPIVVTGFLLIRMEQKLDQLSGSIQNLADAIRK